MGSSNSFSINHNNPNEIFNEDDQLNGLTENEFELRNKNYPGGIYRIPDEIIYAQRPIENGIEGDVTWILFNKVYGCWFGVVTSSHRVRADGTKGCVLFRDTNWKDLKHQLKINIIKEKNSQNEYMSKRSERTNTNRVRRVMGIENVDPNLIGDDIF